MKQYAKKGEKIEYSEIYTDVCIESDHDIRDSCPVGSIY